MDMKDLKKEYVGKKLLNIIDLDVLDSVIKYTLQKITKNDYSGIDNAKLLLFEGNRALVFVDFDSDGYRSGDWHLIDIKKVLDKKQTTGIKIINSIVRNIEYVEDLNAIEYVLITTDEYIIKMGQDNTDSYYPSNFFDVEDCKKSILGTGEFEVIEKK